MRVLGIGKETSFKAGATPDLWLDLIGHSVSVRRENLWMESAWHRTPHAMFGGPYVVEGDIDLILTPLGAARLLYLAMGSLYVSVPDDEVSPKAWNHDLRISNGGLPSAEFDLIFDGNAFKILGTVVRRLEIAFVARELAAATVGILGAKVTTATATGSPIHPEVETPWKPATMIVHRNDEDVAYKIHAIRITLENSVADDAHVLNSLELPQIFTQGVEITGEIEWMFSNWDEYQRFLGGAEPSADVSPVRYQIEIFDGSTGSSVAGYENERLMMILPRCYLTESDVHFTRRERIVQRISFKVATDPENESAPMQVYIVTTRDSP